MWTSKGNILLVSEFPVRAQVKFYPKHCIKKLSFPIRTANVVKSAENADFVTFTEDIRNGKLHFLCSEKGDISRSYFTIKILVALILNLIQIFATSMEKAHFFCSILFVISILITAMYLVY